MEEYLNRSKKSALSEKKSDTTGQYKNVSTISSKRQKQTKKDQNREEYITCFAFAF